MAYCPAGPNNFIPYYGDCNNPPAYARTSSQSIGAAPSGQPNAVNQNPTNCDPNNSSLFGSAALGKAACLLTTPQFWKLAAIALVGVLLIGSGVLLAAGATIAGASNKYV